MLREIMIGVLAAVFAMLATMAISDTGPSRSEVEAMITQSENRTMSIISEIKSSQRSMLDIQQTILIQQGEIKARLEYRQ
jgi:hypothetical protein